ncbi:MAG: hypothetical protein KDD55_01125 [Bdellovibrionales bacterium]|nr:hypothetical protein [Bdellovibrionales bacterium]
MSSIFIWTVVVSLITAIAPIVALIKRGYPIGATVWGIANAVLAYIVMYITLPAHVGPFWGMTIILILFAVSNTSIARVATSIYYESGARKVAVAATVVWGAFVLLAAIIGIGSTMWFVDDAKLAIAGTVTEVEWKDVLNRPVDANPQNMRVRDERLAAWKAQQAVADSDDRGLGSRVNIGDGTIQKIDLGDGHYIQEWVFPLEHAGFWKWVNNSGTPGYITVSAEDELAEAKLVESIDGKPIVQNFMPSSYFGQDLKRHLYTNGYTNISLEDFTYELDDSGRPFWVISLTKPTKGYAVRKVTGLLVVNPQSGDIKEYSLEEVPSWVDRVYPQDIAVERFNWHGKFQDGWLNATFAQEGVLQSTPFGTNPDGSIGGFAYFVVGDDGATYWMSGMTSVNTADTALDSFKMMNTRTGEIIEYRQSGLNEVGAMSVANDKFANFNGAYQASQPIPYNVYGRLAIVTPIVADGKRLQKIAIVDIESEVIGVGDTKAQALADFALAIGEEPETPLDPTQVGESKSVSGTISRMGSYQLNGTTHYIFQLNELEGVYFRVKVSLNDEELPLTEVGQQVSIEYTDNGARAFPVVKFDNESF